MRHAWALLVGVLVVVAMGVPAADADGKGKDPVKDPPKGKVAANVAFMDALSGADNPVNLTDVQKRTIENIVKTRDKELDAWDKANKAKIEMVEQRKAKLDRKKQDREIKQIDAAVKQLEAQKEMISVGAEQRAYAVLTPEQKGKWNGQALHEAVAGKFRLLMLTDDQDKKLTALCEAAGKMMAGPLPSEPKQRDVIVEAMEKRAAGLLTAAQKKQYAEWNVKPTKGPAPRKN
jgi:Spy/CpxP family protein refolding chaperone